MAPKTARYPKKAARSLAAHPTLGTAGNDAWQRQADSAAWSVVSGMPAHLYLGGIEPIEVPAELKARLREAGKALADMPSAERADALLRIAHEAAYGGPPTEPAFRPAQETVENVPADDWWDSASHNEKPMAAVLEEFAREAFAALQSAEPDPEGAGEQAEGDWW